MSGYQRSLLAIVISLAIGAVVVACAGGGTGSQDPTYADAGAVSEALSKVGHPCASYAPQTPSGLGSNFVDTEASCTIEGVHLTIDTFKDSAAETNWLGSLKASACASASSLGLSSYAFVQGNRWVITGSGGDGVASFIVLLARGAVRGIAKVAPCDGSTTASSTTSHPQTPSP